MIASPAFSRASSPALPSGLRNFWGGDGRKEPGCPSVAICSWAGWQHSALVLAETSMSLNCFEIPSFVYMYYGANVKEVEGCLLVLFILACVDNVDQIGVRVASEPLSSPLLWRRIS